MKLQKIYFLGVGLGLTLAFSCKKVDELKDLAGGWTAATDAVQSMSSLSDLYSQTSQIGDSELRSGDCFNTTVTRGANQSTAIIDFDNGTCSSSLRPRSGQINVTLTGASYTVTNAVLTATTSNYVVNGYRVAGTQTITQPRKKQQPAVAISRRKELQHYQTRGDHSHSLYGKRNGYLDGWGRYSIGT